MPLPDAFNRKNRNSSSDRASRDMGGRSLTTRAPIHYLPITARTQGDGLAQAKKVPAGLGHGIKPASSIDAIEQLRAGVRRDHVRGYERR